MLLFFRFSLAIACSVIAFKYVRHRESTHGGDDSEAKKEIQECGGRVHAKLDTEEEEDGMRINTLSPVSSGKSLQENDLLLPEFDDIFQAELGLPPESEESSVKIMYDNDDVTRINRESESNIELSKYFLNAKNGVILEILEATRSSIDKIQINNNCTNPEQKELLEKQEDACRELEKKLYMKNAEIEKISTKLITLEELVIKQSGELKHKKHVKEELELARKKIKDLHKLIRDDTSRSKAQLLILREQVAAVLQDRDECLETGRKMLMQKELEIEVFELRRRCKELQHQKRELMILLDASESKFRELSSMYENDERTHMQARVNLALRLENEDLRKQVEYLQMNQFSEVEELVYLRWVNACLRYELRNHKPPLGTATSLDLNKSSSPISMEKAKQFMMRRNNSPELLATKYKEFESENNYDGISSLSLTPSEHCMDGSVLIDACSSSVRTTTTKTSGLISKLWRRGRSKERDAHRVSVSAPLDPETIMPSTMSKGPLKTFIVRNENDPSCLSCGSNDSDFSPHSNPDTNRSLENCDTSGSMDPNRSFTVNNDALRNVDASPDIMSKYLPFKDGVLAIVLDTKGNGDQGIIESMKEGVVSQSKMEELSLARDKFDILYSGTVAVGKVKKLQEVVELYHSLMRRAKKKDTNSGDSDVTVSDVSYNGVVGELENQSSFSQAVNQEVKTHGYHDLKDLDMEITSFKDDPDMPSEISLKRMLSLLEKVEQSVFKLLRTQNIVVAQYKESNIPAKWMLEPELVGKVKLATLKLARLYMRRVVMELDYLESFSATQKEPYRDNLVLQGVSFAFRVHQFAGGFDKETMHMFKELRGRVHDQYVNVSTDNHIVY